MSDTLSLSPADVPSPPAPLPPQHFHACVGQFDDPANRATIDQLAAWVEDFYSADLRQRPSKHVYIRNLPEKVIEQIDELRDSAVIRAKIRRHFDARFRITPMKHTDELYISHYNKDFGGDQGLYSKHYDGNLRFLPVGSVVRALIYLQSDATYQVVFGHSHVAKAFTTYEFGLLDFHRELHWVEGEYNPSDQQRILLKCNYLVVPENSPLTERALWGMNTGVFYLVKSAMEYSKSPKNFPQRAIGLVCNIVRLLNNVHPLVPIALLALTLAAVVWAIVRLSW